MSMHRHSVSFAHDESPSKFQPAVADDGSAEHMNDPLRCGVLMVGNASGASLMAAILKEGKSFMHYIQNTIEQEEATRLSPGRQLVTGNHVTPGLVEVAGVSVVEYWNRGCSLAERIMPKHDIFIATSHESHEEYVSWSRGNIDAGEKNFIALENIIRVDDDCVDDTMRTAAAFIEKTGWRHNLLVVDLEYVCSSEYSFQKFLEHATVRMRDCVTIIETASSSVNTESTVDTFVHVDGIQENPKIVSVAEKENEADSVASLARETTESVKGVGGAVMYVHKASLPLLRAYGTTAADSSDRGCSSVASFMKYLLAEGTPVYGLPMDVVVPLKRVEDLRYTTALFEHVQRTKFKQRAAAKTQVTDSEVENILMSNPAEYTVTEHKLRSKRSTMDVLKVKKDFDSRYVAMLKERELGNMSSGSQAYVDSLPERFANVALRKHEPRIQHPVYQTTNNSYGLKPASQQQTTLKYYGIRGTFTNDFSSMMYKNTGFNTTRTTSKVHRQMDDF